MEYQATRMDLDDLLSTGTVVILGKRIRRNGFLRSTLDGDINLSDTLSLTETLYAASQASLIVSSLSFMRACSALFSVPVIELLDRSSQKEDIVRKTEEEYRDGQYGISSLNTWFRWPEEYELFSEKLKEYCRIRHRTEHTTVCTTDDTPSARNSFFQ